MPSSRHESLTHSPSRIPHPVPVTNPSPSPRHQSLTLTQSPSRIPHPVPVTNPSPRPMYEFSCGRSSPVEGPAETAKSAAERERTNQLAQPKKVHSEHQASREVRVTLDVIINF